jgi:hypothetical protein
MPTLPRRTTAVALVAGLALVAPLLAGCSLIPHPGGGGGVNIPGVGSVGSGSLPKSWPSDVPVVKGDVVVGAATSNDEGKVWNATIKAGDADPTSSITDQLTGAGFTAGDAVSTGDGSTMTFTKDDWNVAIVVAHDKKEGYLVNYTVIQQPQDGSTPNG